MQEQQFIENLCKLKAAYHSPESAIDQANSCDTLSRDIYTDNQRFIYELLQNADDASSRQGVLDFRIDFADDYLVVSHKGEPFSEIDIESISSVGDGTKAGDEKKIGFKGIGFKSVFAHSDNVTIKSENYCFKFDKNSWTNYWDESWGSHYNWQQMREKKKKIAEVKMPFQILPIWTDVPDVIKTLHLDDYTVSTIIKLKKISSLEKDLNDLFSTSQIVLFLRSQQVKVSINSKEPLTIDKTYNNGKITIQKNNIVISEWIIKNDSFDIPPTIKEELQYDDQTPKKLKEATMTEISFALPLQNNRISAISKNDSYIFSYLPTSIDMGFPFLVNATFLTDASRQRLHNDSVWNQWIFTEIAYRYFNWIAELADDESYGYQIYNVIPNKLHNGLLGDFFNEGFEKAIDEIAFVKNQNGELILAKNALYDDCHLSEIISSGLITTYLNQEHNKSYNENCIVDKRISQKAVLERLGVYIFGIDELDGFITSETFRGNHQLSENFNFIEFLYKRATNDNYETDNWSQRLESIPFIFDENCKLCTPSEIYFPSVTYQNDLADNISIIHKDIVVKIEENHRLKSWLEELGVQEPTDASFIEKTIIGDKKFITTDNAIDVGRYLFKAYKRGEINYLFKLSEIKLLTSKGNLLRASDCYLSTKYVPVFELQSFSDIDIFVSEQYVSNYENVNDWKAFFTSIGVEEDIKWHTEKIDLLSDSWNSRFDCKFIQSAACGSEKLSWISGFGFTLEKKPAYYDFHPNSVYFKSFTNLKYAFNNITFSTCLFKRLFDSIQVSDINEDVSISGFTGMIPRSVSSHWLMQVGCSTKYFEWVMQNVPMIPTLSHGCQYASKVFTNSPEITDVAGDYLQIIKYDGIVPPSWVKFIGLKNQFELDDYLNLLVIFANEEDSEKQKVNKERILRIYDRLADMLLTMYSAERERISNWGKDHKLRANDGKFYQSSELDFITIDGFNSDKQIYANDREKEKYLELFKLLGVHIIDSVTPAVEAKDGEYIEFKSKLSSILPLLALVTDKDDNWKKEYDRLLEKNNSLETCAATSIKMSYGNDEDVIDKSVYLDGNKCYIVAPWNRPRIISDITEMLCKYFHLKMAIKDYLTVFLQEDDVKENLEYLKEKNFDVSQIPDEYLTQMRDLSKAKSVIEEIRMIEDDIEEEGLVPTEGLGSKKRQAFAMEAQEKIMSLLESKGCSFEDKNHSYTVLYSIKRPDGTLSKAIMKGASKGYIYFTPREWLELAENHAMLMIVDGNHMVRNVNLNELITDNTFFHMRFKTQNFAVDTNLKVFARFFRPMPRNSVHFVFKAPFNMSMMDYLADFGMDKQNTSAIELTSDDINLLP